MISRRVFVVSLAVGTLLATGLSVSAKSGLNLIRLLDTDNDGTVDLGEARAAASAMFYQLERDKDGTLTKEEYLAVVEQRFRAADPDHDGTLDAKELKSGPGRALLRLLK